MRHLLSAADLDQPQITEIWISRREMSLVQGRPVEAAGAPRPYRGQSLLRRLHPNPIFLRDRR